MTVQIKPIARIHSPYKDKFAVPRQPGLVKSAKGSIEFYPEFADPNCIKGIEQFSHLWLIFQFHQTFDKGWSPLIRPPRLGGNKKMGVFASRSTHRPNAIGMSVVELEKVEQAGGQLNITVKGIDLVDGTPIIDIKPYVPYADALPDAKGGYAQIPPNNQMPVVFSQLSLEQIEKQHQHPDLKQLISEVLAQDPRPAYQNGNCSDRIYGMNLYDYNIRWCVQKGVNQVIDATPTNPD